jgi:hypothetical protein
MRRSILYFASARFVIAVPLWLRSVHEERALLCAFAGADRLPPSKADAAGASNDKRAL